MRTKEARRPAAGMHLAPGANHGQLACASAPSVEDNGLCPRHRFFCLGLRPQDTLPVAQAGFPSSRFPPSPGPSRPSWTGRQRQRFLS